MNMTWNRRSVAAVAAIALTGLLSACGAPEKSAGATYPQQNIDVVVPYPAGGGSDVIARALVDEVNANGDLGHDLQVVNKPGGAGIVGITELVGAKPDGYTIAIAPVGPISLHPSMAEVSYDPLTDIETLAGLTQGGSWIAVPAGSPYQTIEDLIAAAKDAPGSITMGGGPPAYQIPLVLLEQETGAKFSHVAFDGDAATTTAILGGNLDATFTQAAAALPQVKAGTMKVLATVGDERSPMLPDVPTLSESGIDVVFEGAYGLYAPAGVSDEVVETLSEAFETAIGSDELKKKAEAVGIDLAYTPADEMTKAIEDQLAVVAKLAESGAV